MVLVFHAPAMIVAYRLDDGEPQPVAALLLRRAVEPVEDMLARQFGFVRRVGYVQGASADADGDFLTSSLFCAII